MSWIAFTCETVHLVQTTIQRLPLTYPSEKDKRTDTISPYGVLQCQNVAAQWAVQNNFLNQDWGPADKRVQRAAVTCRWHADSSLHFLEFHRFRLLPYQVFPFRWWSLSENWKYSIHCPFTFSFPWGHERMLFTVSSVDFQCAIETRECVLHAHGRHQGSCQFSKAQLDNLRTNLDLSWLNRVILTV
jgi:hypothetical protein